MRLSLAYVAAFLDCDGSISIYRRERPGRADSYGAKINFYSQNLSVLQDIKETVGGEITPPNFSLDVFTLQLAPKGALAAAKVLVPVLRIKREQALLLIEFQNSVNATRRVGNRSGKVGAGFLPESVFENRRVFYVKMQELNAKDSQAFRTNRDNSVKAPQGVTPSQAVEGEGSTEGVTTREMSPNNNSLHETPARKGRHSLGSARTDIQ